ncbi:MAG: hypothetical protein QXI36_02900 [Candidatus Bathyarchaeia archaeon]
MKWQRILFFLCLFILICTISFFRSENYNESIRKNDGFISFSLIVRIDDENEWQNFVSFLESTDFHNFTFVLDYRFSNYMKNHVMINQTRINFLKNYGKMIPVFSLMIASLSPRERESYADNIFKYWYDHIGEYPKGIFTFMPDTYTVNYLHSKYGILYIQGYCFDQYLIDWMTTRGGWQLPYYASPFHILRPNNVYPRGVVVFPHITWDWVASFTHDHQYSTHILGTYVKFNRNSSLALNYIIYLSEETLGRTTPFGFVSIQAEWGWALVRPGLIDEFSTLIDYFVSKGFRCWTYEDVAKWFLTNYDFTPSYHLIFTSPVFQNETIEWFYCLNFRVARIGSKIVSYVDYTAQENDVSLLQKTAINTSKPQSPENCLDNSLTFEIDALGGAPNRAPIKTEPYTYTGELKDFPLHYNLHKTTIYSYVPTLEQFTFFILSRKLDRGGKRE